MKKSITLFILGTILTGIGIDAGINIIAGLGVVLLILVLFRELFEVLNEDGKIEVTQKNEAELKSIIYELMYNYYC
jgi:hypothetical protein